MLTSQDLAFFAVLASEPSLAAAARSLDVTPPAVSQRLQVLERRLGMRLVDRSGSRLSLTSEGALLAERGQAVLEDLESLAAELRERRDIVSGPLHVAAPLGFGRAFVAQAMARMRQLHPAVELKLTLLDDPASGIRSDRWDVLVQVGPLADSALAMRRLAPNRRVLCASPAYLEARGHPIHPQDLGHHVCGVIREDQADVTLWSFGGDDGETATIRVRPELASNDGEVIKAWALAGLCIVQRSEWDIAGELRAGHLIELLPSWRMPDADVVALLGPRQGRAARMERFVQVLKDLLTPVPWR
ncbi:LysR family transcriptional regulator [Aureimonas ureilytica]|uniref:LysR family transcriptional regulator n=1 Tax=Aureimonas ureilytica TaxID=401562 RepID=A0A175RQ42_9HYPH|nr:LysR family transcriptional regulator [Aureimonas ureilytica]KTR05551.1 LysR family transcriptional regulator [Aureimonas ureilytica]